LGGEEEAGAFRAAAMVSQAGRTSGLQAVQAITGEIPCGPQVVEKEDLNFYKAVYIIRRPRENLRTQGGLLCLIENISLLLAGVAHSLFGANGGFGEALLNQETGGGRVERPDLQIT
jgi:hypothetical protein